jgi:plastocyanin
MRSVTLAVSAALLWSFQLTLALSQEQEVVGCITQSPNDGLQLGSRSGNSYVLHGDTALLIQHVNQLVQVRGQVSASGSTGSLAVLNAATVDVVSETCGSALPARKPQAVVGKAGEGQVAIPITTTASANQNTPGFQTEDVSDQELPGSGQSRPTGRAKPNLLYAPGNTAQAAQSATAAEIYAQSATRTEIQPGNTLGAETALANSGTEAVAPGRKPITVELSGDRRQTFSPARITVRVGQTVEWRNATGAIHEIVANPTKQKQETAAVLPQGTRPFDSGLLQPGATFHYTFTTPGTFHYFCAMNCSGTPGGEVVVGR